MRHPQKDETPAENGPLGADKLHGGRLGGNHPRLGPLRLTLSHLAQHGNVLTLAAVFATHRPEQE